MDLQNKKVLVFGTGISGIAAAQLLKRMGACPVLFDGNATLKKEDIYEKLGESETELYLGELPGEVIEQLSLVVLSPGVPTDLPLVNTLRERGLRIWGEIELAYENSRGDVLAITGTNGKTTTTSLLGAIMEHVRDSVFIVGNIGTPYTQMVTQTADNSVTVAEISSFQLETIEAFRPKVSAILNITPDHLNRHHTMEEYIRVKELITANQTPEDTCVLNYEDEVLRKFGQTLSCRVIFFSSLRTLEKGISLNGDMIEYRDGNSVISFCSTKELKLPGRHNYENVMAAAAMALAYGVSVEDICYVLKRFTAVEHRIEFVAEVDGVVYYNDSKGTNPDAAIKGIQAMDRPTLLIGGGYDKNSDYEEWIRAFDGKVRCLVLIGQTREKIRAAAERCGFTDTVLCDSFEEAFRFCAEHAQKGDAVLLSPACASWGMFQNYEVRGRVFKEMVHRLEKR
ncbi:MAG: UDP-N-acetylmuramoyl-L-alanine--D-glutamate ligase [Marvinbryantia sp.]|uniref:UDP-N-acetylmuramoyl-L-alanine--D-glutamate ligase n=1 Tax=Marvinbryantia sp. TaxID=2496532 RepID=UPI0025E6236F|nr:UDP-N-acetylmuramoyl-L-alanine--D-glutamate ligase [uncultured Marvinbryantia sp.]